MSEISFKLEGLPAIYSVESERSLLGAILSEPETVLDKVIESGLSPDDFFVPAHGDLFKALVHMRNKSLPIDSSTVIQYLSDRKIVDSVGGAALLGDLAAGVVSVMTYPAHIKTIRSKSVLRKLQAACAQIVYNSYENQHSPSSIIDEAEILIAGIQRESRQISGHGSKVLLNEDLCVEVFEEIKAHVEGGSEPKFGLRTGIKILDDNIGGLRPNELYIIAARTSVGKSAFAVQLARSIGSQCPVGVITLEMSARDITLRNLAAEGRIPLSNLREAAMTKQALDMLSINARGLVGLPIRYKDQPYMESSDFRASCRQLVNGYGCKAIVVDYLQLIRSEDKSLSRVQEVSEITWMMKTCAMDLKIPVIALAQLNRKSEEDSEPELYHLRESSSIEQDSDVVILMWRDKEITDQQIQDAQYPTNFKIAKNRNGAQVMFKMTLDGKHCRFV